MFKKYTTAFLTRALALLTAVTAVSCISDMSEEHAAREGDFLTGFRIAGQQTRSLASDDGLSTTWENGDEVALWARNSSGEYVLEGRKFSMMGLYGSRGWLTATLSGRMPEDTYTYYASYPFPVSVEGSVAEFEIPSVQDGLASQGADIMVSSAVSSGPLLTMKENTASGGLSVSMDHLLHIFRFYIPEDVTTLGGESVRKLVLRMPAEVAGTLTVDVSSPQSAELTHGTSELTLELAEPLSASAPGRRDYVFATVFPFRAEDSDVMEVRLFTENHLAVVPPFALRGRDFQAGHATAVALVPERLDEIHKLIFTVASNHLGEDVDRITLTAPEGCDWGSGSNVFTYDPGKPVLPGGSFSVDIPDSALYEALSRAEVTVEYDSRHVLCSQTLTLPDLTGTKSADVSLDVPYLLYEDFSSVHTFSSHDAYSGGFVNSSYDPVSFLGGWTAARSGASAGSSIRIACRRETFADYPARSDSRPMFTIKEPVDLEVSFDYGADYKAGGLGSSGKLGQTVYLGYVTDTKAYKSGDTSGTFEQENSFYIKEQTGSYTKLPHTAVMTLHSVPSGSSNRITWRTVPEHSISPTNTTSWLYIDNVRVSVAPGQ